MSPMRFFSNLKVGGRGESVESNEAIIPRYVLSFCLHLYANFKLGWNRQEALEGQQSHTCLFLISLTTRFQGLKIRRIRYNMILVTSKCSYHGKIAPDVIFTIDSLFKPTQSPLQ